MTAYLLALDAQSSTKEIPAVDGGTDPTTHNEILTPFSEIVTGGAQVSKTNPLITQAGAKVTAIGGTAFEVETASEAVIAIAAGLIETTAYIANPASAPADLIVDPVNEPQDWAPGPNGTSIALPPGAPRWDAPCALTGAVWVNSAANGHVFTVVVF